LFIGDVGRPDLRVALGWKANDLGGLLYHSLRDKLLTLPDSAAVYPAHGAGSLCGKAISKETVSTIGEQRRSNYALQPMSKEAFVALVTADQPDAPAYFTYDAVLNSQERPTLDKTMERVNALTLDQVLSLQAVGAQVLDTRDPAEFAAAHLKGSINVGLGGQYATWAGTILTHEKPIVVIADPGREQEAVMRLGRIGFDQVVGYLEDGLHSVRSRPELTMSTERLSAQVAADRVAQAPGDRAPVMVDVRAPGERQQKRIAGSVGIPLSQLGARLAELPADRPLLVYCAGGYRSSIAASLLQHHGFTQVSEIAGGIAAWDAGNLPVET
jgi:hydroxyacylglutathione hydrolase